MSLKIHTLLLGSLFACIISAMYAHPVQCTEQVHRDSATMNTENLAAQQELEMEKNEVESHEADTNEFRAENLAYKSDKLQQAAEPAQFHLGSNQADESRIMYDDPALSQMDDQHADIASDESYKIAVDELATIQQQSLQDLEDAMEGAEKQVDGNTKIADSIVALLQGEDITEARREHEEPQRATSQDLLDSFNSGLQVFVNQMNRMISKYSNVLNCLPRMQAEMPRSDRNNDELVKTVVNRLANIQGKQNRQIRQLFQKIRQFIQTTSGKDQTLYKKIRHTLGRILRSYEEVINCIRRRQG